MPKDDREESTQAGPHDPVVEAVRILLRIAERELHEASNKLAKSMLGIDQELEHVRYLLSQAQPNSETEMHRYLAAKTALEALESNERKEPLLPYKDQFSGHVEAVRGGEGAKVFGGKRISNKPDAKTAFLRAALYVLWEHYRGDDTARSALVKEAVSLGIIGNRIDSQAKNEAAVKTRIGNIKKRPCGDHGSAAPESEHIDLVRRLVNDAGYRKLADFR